MPNEQVVVLDPPLRVASYSEKFNELFENLDCIKDEISIYSSTQNDQTRSELSIVKLNLIMAINGIKSLLLPYISELLDDLVASNSLKREINNLNDDLEFVKSTRTSFAETSSSRDLKQVLSYANFALNGIKCIREKVEKIMNLKFVYINSVEGWFAGIRADYKLIGSLLHVRNDSNLSMIQERIDRISKPLFGFPNEPGDTDEGSMTFIAFVGPSLTGKSQMAFTLAHRQPVLYFNFTSNNQPIYTPFKEISQVMIDFLQQDFKKLKQSTDVGDFPGAQWLSENHLIPLSSLGFLHELVKVGLDFSDTEGYWFDKYLRLNMIAMDELSIADFQRKLGN